ncbi:hypothetical protein CGCSCA4_v013334 [Colletotrichum siamense]|uniref:Uncharacterized protein n=1 Tax=Colletotrichum siamense TaxID=690259 RepID=A0A9P5EII6_COLSI|nr:hypothetical protein CGCSCA5_v013829 [Colletotrichum siamense]KAI8186628.1 hypothetical protein K4K51_010304 [Colletotrichum sp. SAR 10_75]KAI8248596.1 hypothetical protein K4K53_000687 [Colletotrichum sp. SAR 10_77]KAF4833489.1 hypothetical protein CGCSCA4_v013334 [Colletotrichum siamense]KAF4846292.1 hypothetical protein CGCSCA2_v013157 [Colletotrichum siamense]
MSRLPAAEKLPLALRKNIRDDWESKKEDLQKQLSDVLGAEWTLNDINPNELYPYAGDGYAKQSLGSCIAQYITSAIYNLKSYTENYGEEGKNEINSICHTRSLIIDLDDRPKDKRVSYCGVTVKDGKLALVFSEGNLGTNVDYAIDSQGLLKALNEAPPAPGADAAMSYAARTSIRQEYDEKIEETRKKLGDMLEKPDIVLVPNFETNFAKIMEESKKKKSEVRDDWESNLGNFTRMYFEGLVYQMGYQKFDEDDLLREGFNEAVDKGEIHFRIVDKMSYATYGEVVVEDGAVYVQTQAKNFGTNVDYAAEKMLDQL